MRRGFSIGLLVAMSFVWTSGCESAPDPEKAKADAQKTIGPPAGKPPGYSAPNKKTGKAGPPGAHL